MFVVKCSPISWRKIKNHHRLLLLHKVILSLENFGKTLQYGVQKHEGWYVLKTPVP